MRILTTLLMLCFLCATARAEGALAITTGTNVVKDGWAYGTAYRYENETIARQRAVENCRKTRISSIRSKCRVIETFKDQCVAVAMDKEDGTPGVGWAVRPTVEEARAVALDECYRTSAPNRRMYCEISSSGCDNNE